MLDLTRESAWEYATGGPWPKPDELSGDECAMAHAIRESLAGIGLASPNPAVGCVLLKDGRIIGRGVHKQAGGLHAELLAINDANSVGESVNGATAYITMEPCCHFGRTPPCTDSLIRGGIKKVVVGVRDLNPRVAGGGLAILKANGIEVVEGVLGSMCSRLHAPFFKTIRTGFPWVMLKLAMGSDNGIGPVGVRANITTSTTQSLAHALRRVSDGILVGRNTVDVDNPQLTDRWPESAEPHRLFRRIVVDSRATLKPDCRIWQKVAGHSTLRALTCEAEPIEGIEDLRLPPGQGGCSLRHLLHELTLRGICRLLVEGGATLAQQMMREGLVDVLHIFRSTKPAGGQAVMLCKNWLALPSKRVRFDGGAWEISERPIWHNNRAILAQP